MKKVYKYQIGLGESSVRMPWGAQVLTAQMQDGKITLWCLVNSDETEGVRHFITYGTGQTIPASVDVSQYIATVQDGPNVWHVFES